MLPFVMGGNREQTATEYAQFLRTDATSMLRNVNEVINLRSEVAHGGQSPSPQKRTPGEPLKEENRTLKNKWQSTVAGAFFLNARMRRYKTPEVSLLSPVKCFECVVL